MLENWADWTRGLSLPMPPLLLVIGAIVLGIPLLVHSASAQSAGPADEPILTKPTSLTSALMVPRRAPRELQLRSKHASHSSPSWVHVDTTASRSQADGVGDAGFKIAGISIGGARGPAVAGLKGPNDRLGDSSLKGRWNEGRNATSNGLSLESVSGIGWLVGALGIGVGTYLMVSSDKRKGHETTLGPDFYSKGAGLRIRRRW